MTFFRKTFFRKAASDTRRDGKERAMYKGLSLRLGSVEFVKNLGAMYDALQELAELSIELQKNDICITEAHRVITRQIKVFEAMVDSPGTHLEIANDAALSDVFKGVTLHRGCKSDVEINAKQLFRSFADNMKNRLLVCNASNMSSTGSEISKPTTEYRRLLECLQVLYPINWPVERDIRYGEKEVVELTDRFRVDSRATVRAFRAFVEGDGKIIHEDLKALLSSVGTIPVSTAECERGFSAMNLIITPARNSLSK